MRTTTTRPSRWASGARSERRGRRVRAAPGGIAALAVVLAGCGRPAGVVFEPADGRYRWPAPPDDPRIAYVGQLRADEDLKPARSFGQRIGATLFGRKAALTMLSPLAVCTDGGDRVFVADSNAQLVHAFDLGTRKYQRWRPPEKAGRFSQPVALAWDPAGRLLVSDSVEAAVLAFDSRGTYLGSLGGDRMTRPCGLVVLPGSRQIAVADAGAHQIVFLAPDGAEVGRLGSRGVAPGRFNFPTHVAIDASGNLYVSDSLNFRVQVFGPDLSPIRQIGSKGDMPGYFAQPKGVAVGPEGLLFVVDAHFEAVQVFGPDGVLRMAFGREGHAPGEFWLPAGIHADPKGRLWIADSYNRRIQVFQLLPTGDTP